MLSFRRRHWPAILLALAALIASPAQAETPETVRLAAGATTTIALTQNPSTGYRWRLNGAASRNLSLVRIADAGFTPGASGRLGAPGLQRFSIAARRPGTAVAVFEYARPWERVAALRRHVVTIVVAGR
jgi:inhibitor of cysteine peptidase